MLQALRANNWDLNAALDSLEGEDEFVDAEEEGGEEQMGDDQLMDTVEQFMANAEFKEVRRQIRENPDKIGEYLEQLRVAHPQLYNAINSDPQTATQILEEILKGSIHDEDYDDDWVDDSPLQQAAQSLTVADENNIEHLAGLTGQSRGSCIEAYLACGKNVEAAANLLLDG